MLRIHNLILLILLIIKIYTNYYVKYEKKINSNH